MDNNYKFAEQIKYLKAKKLAQTQEKIEKEGSLDEDDYGRIVPPKGLWNIIPNNEDGSFYGYDAWTENFCSLMDIHPTYIDSYDAFAGRWMFFMSKMRKHKWNPKYPYTHLQTNIDKYNIICGIGDDAHFAPDYSMGIKSGWGGLLKKIEYYKSVNTSPEAKKFYDLHTKAIISIQGWISRHITEAEKMADVETDEIKRKNLTEIVRTNKKILFDAPSTLREACQWIIWYHLASRTYNRDGAGGQIDTLLLPFYEKDIKNGIIDKDTAIYYLACFLLNDPIYWQLGGPDKDGNDQTSEMSFLILEAADKINTSLNLTIRVHDKMNRELLRKGVEYLIKNKNGWPRFSGDQALVEGFTKNGFSNELARQRIAVGCNWMSLPGLEYTLNDLVKVNFAKIFEVAFQELEKLPEKSIEKLWSTFKEHLEVAVHTAAEGIRHHLKYQKYNEPELILNLLSHGPMEKAKDVSDEGAEYYNLAIDGAGLAVVADSFAAIERHISEKKEIDWNSLYSAINNNFGGEDGKKVLSLLKNTDRFGKENSCGEKWALKIKDCFCNFVRKESEPNLKRCFIPGLFSWANTVEFGKEVGASPDGRLAEKPISHGANPSPGFAVDGASLSLVKAVAKIQPGFGNTAPMQWELDPIFATQDNVNLVYSIIMAHFKLGGTLINVNIMDKEKVIEAHKDPSKYPDLVVRVTGFTAYFSMLSPEFRQLVVDRILQS